MVDIYDDRGIDQTQDENEFRRRLAGQIRENARELDRVRDLMPSKPPWWTNLVLGIVIALLGGYIGIVHQMAASNRERIERLAETQNRQYNLDRDVQDLKARIASTEAASQRIPAMALQLDKLNDKLDRLNDRLMDRNRGIP